MQKIAKILPLAALVGLLGCEDNASECEQLFHDKQKQPLAFDYCKKAADQGNATAQLRAAELLFQQGGDKNEEQAVEYLTKSTNQHQPQALFLMAQRREQSGSLEGAEFYYEQSCKRNVVLACEWLAKRKQQLENQKQEEQKRHQAELAAAEQARKEAEQKRAEAEKSRLEAERLKQEAEEKAKQAEEKARLDAERAKQEAQEQARLAEEKAKQTAAVQNRPLLSQAELRQTYSDFVAELERNNFSFNALETWVKNCYTNSTAKKGCFYFDVLASVTDELLSHEDKSRSTHSFFKDYTVRSRARQNIPEFSNLSVEQTEALFRQVADELMQNSHLFEEMGKVRQQRLANKATNAKNADQSRQKFEQNGLWGFTDSQGNVVIPARFLAVGGFYDGLAVVQSDNKQWGFIDKSGNWVVLPQFCMAGRFSEGLAGAYKNGYLNAENQCVGGKWGYLNTAGNWAINPIFEHATVFKNGKAKVTYQGKTGYINQLGNWAE